MPYRFRTQVTSDISTYPRSSNAYGGPSECGSLHLEAQGRRGPHSQQRRKASAWESVSGLTVPPSLWSAPGLSGRLWGGWKATCGPRPLQDRDPPQMCLPTCPCCRFYTLTSDPSGMVWWFQKFIKSESNKQMWSSVLVLTRALSPGN